MQKAAWTFFRLAQTVAEPRQAQINTGDGNLFFPWKIEDQRSESAVMQYCTKGTLHKKIFLKILGSVEI